MNRSLRTMYDNRESILAWFEPSKGPEDIIGVRLAYIDPVDRHFERALEEANLDKDTPRALNILHSISYYADKEQKYFTPDAGWWMSRKDYIDGKEGWGFVTRAKLEEKYYSIAIHETRAAAIAAAEKAGII